ncbi:MAG: hypothetical protein JNM84_23705 [Planctomycetes bacterium]|nr:hypothetical protein [Planctomycetota bacterium]
MGKAPSDAARSTGFPRGEHHATRSLAIFARVSASPPSPLALSPSAEHAVARVRALLVERAPARWPWQRARASPAPLLAAIAELGARAELGTLPVLLELALDSAPLVRREAQRALLPLARTQLDCADTLLQPMLRRGHRLLAWGPWSTGATANARIAAEIAAKIDVEHGAALAAFASLHGNGWVREAALRTLCAAETDWAWGYVARLALDHVPQIRARAIDGLRRWGQAPTLAGALSAPGMVLRLFSSKSPETRAVAEVLWTEIHAPGHWPEIERGLSQAAAKIRLDWYERVASQCPELRALALACLRRDPTQRLRLRAAELQRAQSAPAGILALARELLGDPAGNLRLAGLRWCGELAGAAELREVVQRSLFDRDRNVRELARYLARARCGLDPLALYRAELTSDHPHAPAVALLGLAEATPPERTLDPADEARLVRALEAASTSGRAAALEALGERCFGRHRLAFFAALQDPASSLRSAAFRAIRRHGGNIRADELRTLRPLARTARKRYAMLVQRGGFWTALREVYQLDPELDGELQGQLLLAFRRRFARNGGAPTSSERRQLDELRATLSPTLRRSLDDFLREA